ncbi:MAG: DUF3396 domain-containing protein [Azoarcus sp.]|jgi:hypothetical protein|nr:DUF3396 domain-containing protein [Azoarcus sp.]
MILPAPDLEDWIEALNTNSAATATALPSSPHSALQKPASWHLGIFASAYFYVISREDVQRLTQTIPQLHKEFQELTGGALTRYLSFGTANIARKPLMLEDIEKHLRDESDGIAALAEFDAPTKESSSRYKLETIAQFEHANQTLPLFRPGIDQPITGRRIEFTERTFGLDYFTVNFPLAFWRSHTYEIRRWWLKALERLQSVQAYMGLGIGLPPILERYPFQQQAEFALANRFLGLDVDKPFFMRSNRPDGMHLETGMRTPGFGVLVAGDYLRRLGGEIELRSTLRNVKGIRIDPCLDGLWIEAGAEPALYPVEQGVPAHLRALAMALKPVRLERLWMVSYPPNLPSDDIFTPETSARWLRRFDSDSDWGGLVNGEPPPGMRQQAQSEVPLRLRAEPGEPCPRTGYWSAFALPGQRVFVRQGEPMPGPEFTKIGGVIWGYLGEE